MHIYSRFTKDYNAAFKIQKGMGGRRECGQFKNLLKKSGIHTEPSKVGYSPAELLITGSIKETDVRSLPAQQQELRRKRELSL